MLTHTHLYLYSVLSELFIQNYEIEEWKETRRAAREFYEFFAGLCCYVQAEPK